MSWHSVPKPTSAVEDDVQLANKLEEYSKLHEYGEEAEKQRLDNYAKQTNIYYDMSTDFYERGWGDCFHFANRYKYETFAESLRRHEYYLALRMKLEKGMKVLDVGCGIGGPLRNIARFSGASIIGLNNNAYQLSRADAFNAASGLSRNCSTVKADFMHIPFPDKSFDAVYQIEATAHAPSKVDVYKEIYRVLKPGAVFGGYEWVLTKKFNPNNAEHVKIRRELEMGSGIPSLPMIDEIPEALKEAGFEIIDIEDLSQESPSNWWEPLAPVWTPSNWQLTKTGQVVIYYALCALEYLRVVPTGTSQIEHILQKGGMAIYNAGVADLFSPMCFHLVRKPL